MVSVLFFAVFGLIGRSAVGQNVDGSTDAKCQIPEGKFNGMVVDSNSKQPYYGNRCAVVLNTFVQVRRLMCMPYYCCDEPCACNGSLQQQSFKCKDGSDSRRLSCFVENIEYDKSLYGCCNGSEEDSFHVCATVVNCRANNGGCDQLCQRSAASGRDYCDCYPGYERQLLDSNGTTRCIGNGPIPAPTSTPTSTPTPTSTSTSTSPPSAAAVLTDHPGLPIPYIIAIVVALILILLLLLLLLFLFCRKKKTEERRAVVNPSIEQKVNPIVVFKDVESGKKKLDDDAGDNMASLDTKYRQENAYSEDPVAGKGGNAEGQVQGQGQLTDEGRKGYDSLVLANNMESDERIYEELK